MKKIAFVILHYNTSKVTEECVESILQLENVEDTDIVIVDNGSTNDSGQYLRELYKTNNQIHLLQSRENLGFANGNNLGYVYAKERLNADCIVVTNNDIIFQQTDFINQIISTEKMSYDLIGPDIVNLADEHQNPFRLVAHSLKQVNKAIVIKRIFLIYFYLKKFLHVENKIMVLENLFNKKSVKRRSDIEWSNLQENVVLQGACLIFMPQFVAKEKKAFCSDTFMYGEEDILSYICKQKGYKTAYIPQLVVRHLEGASTNQNFCKSIEKEIFVYKHTIQSLKVLQRLMKENSEK